MGMVSSKNEVFEYLIDQLRQHVNSHPYKQQCEDLAHEVLSLKNQLRDASALVALVAELQEDNIKKSDHISHLTGQLSAYRNDALRFQAQVGDLVKRLAKATGDESVQIKELTLALDSLDNEVMCLRSIVDLDPKGAIGYIRRANSAMTDTLRRQYLSKALEELGCKDAPEQSGCRKEDAQLPVCSCIPAHCGTYYGNTVVCDNCGGAITE